MKKDKSIINDGCRISNYRDSFEWWYFDFDLGSKYHIYLEWHAPNFTLRDTSCLLIIRISDYENKSNNPTKSMLTQRMKVFRYHRSLTEQSISSCNIKFPSGHIIENNGNYFITIDEKNLSINLKLERLLPAMSPEDEVVYSTNDGNEFFSWNVPLPRALATGQISFDGEEIAVDGIAYHDHNWGNLNIRKCLRGWIWARVLFNNFTLIFADIKTRAPEEKVRILLFIDKDGNKIDTSFLQSDDIHFTNQNRSDLQLPQKITISFNNRQTYTVHLTIKQHYPVQEFPLGSLENHLWNSLLTKAYYLFKLNNAPCFIKKIFGQNLYFQFIINAELYVDDALIETHNGNLEVFSFAD